MTSSASGTNHSIADAEPINRGPLSGVRVLAIEQFGAGPFCTLQLADAGAEIIKIEDPANDGDVGRSVPPNVTGDSSLYFETFNRGKRSIAIDLKSKHGRAEFELLVKGADVVFNNLRGDLPGTLKLTYEHLAAINPRIVCASLSAYGRTGGRAVEPGYDALIQAEAGWASMTGEPDGPPVKSGLSMVDYATGLFAAFGIAAAIFDAHRTGRGRDVDVSLYDSALSLLTYPATWFLSGEIPFERQTLSAHPSIVPFQMFETADGYIAIACAKEKFFTELVMELDLQGLVDDHRFAGFAARLANKDVLLGLLQLAIGKKTTNDLLDALRGRVPCAPVRSMEEALDLDELRSRGLLVEYEHQVLGSVRTVGTPTRFSGFEPRAEAGPHLDADRQFLMSNQHAEEPHRPPCSSG